jgi:beta-glucosidase
MERLERDADAGEVGHVRYGEGVFVGYRGYDALDLPVSHPFGHGLSYTDFEYAHLTATLTGSAEDGTLAVAVACKVTNTGQRPGKEVLQLYVADPETSVRRPPRELKGFAKTATIAPGEDQTVTFQLRARDLSYWSVRQHRWVLEGGTFELKVGASFRDLRLTTAIEVTVPSPTAELDGMATLEEWLAHPVGAGLLCEAVGVDERGRPRGILGDEELIRVIGNFPISTLAAFPGLGIDHATVDHLLRRLPPQ